MAPSLPSPVKTWHNDTYPAIDPSRPDLSVAGKAAVVTGAGGVIGFAIAKALARAGISHLALTGRTTATLERSQKEIQAAFPNTKVSVYAVDAASNSSTKYAFQDFRSTVGHPLNILVHAAGFFPKNAPVATHDPEEFFTSVSININGAFNTAQAFLAVADPTATIINVSSGTGHIHVVGPLAGCSGYAVGKVAPIRMFEYVQFENPGMTVVNMQPGIIESPLNSKHGVIPPSDTPELPAHYIVWLCSPEASFLKGKFVWSNWDVDELKALSEKITTTPFLTLNLEGWPFAA